MGLGLGGLLLLGLWLCGVMVVVVVFVACQGRGQDVRVVVGEDVVHCGVVGGGLARGVGGGGDGCEELGESMCGRFGISWRRLMFLLL